jgi:hypothetical protein
MRFTLCLVSALVGVAVIWMFFYFLGKGLLLVPPSYNQTHPKQPQAIGSIAAVLHSVGD